MFSKRRSLACGAPRSCVHMQIFRAQGQGFKRTKQLILDVPKLTPASPERPFIQILQAAAKCAQQAAAKAKCAQRTALSLHLSPSTAPTKIDTQNGGPTFRICSRIRSNCCFHSEVTKENSPTHTVLADNILSGLPSCACLGHPHGICCVITGTAKQKRKPSAAAGRKPASGNFTKIPIIRENCSDGHPCHPMSTPGRPMRSEVIILQAIMQDATLSVLLGWRSICNTGPIGTHNVLEQKAASQQLKEEAAQRPNIGSLITVATPSRRKLQVAICCNCSRRCDERSFFSPVCSRCQVSA